MSPINLNNSKKKKNTITVVSKPKQQVNLHSTKNPVINYVNQPINRFSEKNHINFSGVHNDHHSNHSHHRSREYRTSVSPLSKIFPPKAKQFPEQNISTPIKKKVGITKWN